jgi:DNA-directed RNA polymerase specialized sigma24 family protein
MPPSRGLQLVRRFISVSTVELLGRQIFAQQPVELSDRSVSDRFEAYRGHLKAVAYRMLGSLSEADDAVQEAWLRLSRTEAGEVENLGGWLTTVVGRVCLDMLRSRTSRREDPLEAHLPDPVISPAVGIEPEQEALLASRARRRVQGTVPASEPDLTLARQVADAFLAASRGGDFNALVAVLDPDVVLRADTPDGLRTFQGAATVAGQAILFGRSTGVPTPVYAALPALVNGTAGLLSTADGQPVSVMSFTIAAGRIVGIDIIADPARLARLDLTMLAN